MNEVLGPDTIEVGMWVTVLGYRPKEIKPAASSSLPGEEWKSTGVDTGVIVVPCEDRSHMGDVLTIKAINYPYVVVQVEDKREINRYVSKVDMRRASLIKLSPEYVYELCPYLKMKEEDNGSK